MRAQPIPRTAGHCFRGADGTQHGRFLRKQESGLCAPPLHVDQSPFIPLWQRGKEKKRRGPSALCTPRWVARTKRGSAVDSSRSRCGHPGPRQRLASCHCFENRPFSSFVVLRHSAWPIPAKAGIRSVRTATPRRPIPLYPPLAKGEREETQRAFGPLHAPMGGAHEAGKRSGFIKVTLRTPRTPAAFGLVSFPRGFPLQMGGGNRLEKQEAELRSASIVDAGLKGLIYPSSFLNSLLAAPHTGHTQSSGSFSNGVPGAMPPSGSPFSGS